MARPLGPVPEHGTRQRYQLRGDACRCPLCTAANNAYVWERRVSARVRKVKAAWTEVQLPPEFMVKCTHSLQDGRDVCAWCGTPLRQAG